MLKRLLIILSVIALIVPQYVFAQGLSDYHSYRISAFWLVILFSLVIEYVLVVNLFKINRFKDAFVMSLLALLMSGSLYLAVLLIANIILVMSGLSASFSINVILGCLFMTVSKCVVYTMAFRLPVGGIRFLGILVSSTVTAFLLSSLSLFL